MTPDLDKVIWIIRDAGNFSANCEIGPDATIQEDLGLDGDDGWELLDTLWEEFGLRNPENEGEFDRAFGTGAGQILFLPEGSFFVPGPHPHELKTRRQRVITVAELHAAILNFVSDQENR